MSEAIQQKLKTYLLYISMFCFFATGIHLSILYIYSDANSVPEEGGTISEAIIGDFPHFNPLIPSSDHNAYINRLLYKSILEYNPENQSFESGIMNCNTDNLLVIECTMQSGMLWSDSSPITPQDVSSTLSIIESTNSHPIIASLLEETTIEVSDTTLTLRNEKKDINFLKVLLQPIVHKSIVEGLNNENITGKFSEIGGIYSGRFRLVNINQDETIGVTKLTLGKNDLFVQNNLFVDFLILNLFRDETHFAKHKSSFNIFNDKNRYIPNPIPRLETFEYSLKQFTGVFFNIETLNLKIRSALADLIDRDSLVTSLGEGEVSAAFNPFLTQITIDGSASSSLASNVDTSGFYSKQELQRIVEANSKIPEPIISDEVVIIEKKVQADIKTLRNPEIKKYNFISEDNILLTGNVPENIEKIFVNDYQLEGYNPGDSLFYYRLSEGFDSIVEGENNYKIYFEGAEGKTFIEEFYVYYYKDDEEKANFEEELFFKAPEQNTNNQTLVGQDANNLQTSLTLEQIENLDEAYSYDLAGNPFSFRLVYTSSDPLMGLSAESIQEVLKEEGIFTQLIPLSVDKITAGIRNNEIEYDMLMLGIDTGYFASNIFPYFHSSQIDNGYNLSNFKKLSLDILLEELKANILSVTKRKELEEKILDIFREEQIMKVLYTPKYHLLVDQNLQNFNFPDVIADDALRYKYLLGTYLSEKKTISWDNKGFSSFLNYLLGKVL